MTGYPIRSVIDIYIYIYFFKKYITYINIIFYISLKYLDVLNLLY